VTQRHDRSPSILPTQFDSIGPLVYFSGTKSTPDEY
jgi:hypothetical protein